MFPREAAGGEGLEPRPEPALTQPHDACVASRPATGPVRRRLLRDFFPPTESRFKDKQASSNYFLLLFSTSACTMGCAISGLGTRAEFGERRTADAASAAVYPREDQVQMIKDSWKVIRDDIAKVGIIMFVR